MNGYNFTDRVRKVLQMAREEAARLHHEYVGTEHLLLGLIREGEGVATAVLTNLNVDLSETKQTIEEIVKVGQATATAGPDLPYTSRAKKVLELAMSEARELNHSFVDTEHLLLGLIREEKGIAAQVLTHTGVNLEEARAETLRLLGGEARSSAPPGETAAPQSRGSGLGGYNFTDRVRKVLQMAREEAARLEDEYVGTEHILLGLIREGGGVAAAVLTNLNVDLEEIQQKIEETVKQGKATAAAGPDLPFTSRAKKVFDLAMSEARELNASYVGTEHLLLGVLREEKGIAAQALTHAGVTLEMARRETLRLLGR